MVGIVLIPTEEYNSIRERNKLLNLRPPKEAYHETELHFLISEVRACYRGEDGNLNIKISNEWWLLKPTKDLINTLSLHFQYAIY